MFAEFLLLPLFCGLRNIAAQLEEGDFCRTYEDRAGHCKFPLDCPRSLKDIQSGKIPKICGFVGERATVCCSYELSAILGQIFTKPRSSTKPTQNKPTSRMGINEGNISRQKCTEYTRLAYPDINLFASGAVVSIAEFPHMVQIGYDAGNHIEWGCGGSIISEYFVLTAAHCLWDRELGKATFIRAGIIKHGDTNKQQKRIVADRIQYDEYKYVDKYHDIGLIRVTKQFHFHQFVRPACLFVENYYPYRKVVVTGWGKTENGQYSKHLLKTTLEIYSVQKCNETYWSSMNTTLKQGVVNDYMICAGSSKYLRDTCMGDSGGPMQYMIHHNLEVIYMYHIVGVTSFGKPCGVAVNLPGIYTRVSAYVDWIEGNVWPSDKKRNIA